MSRAAGSRRATSVECDCGCRHLQLAQIGDQVHVSAKPCACGIRRRHKASVTMDRGDPLTLALASELEATAERMYPLLVGHGLIRFGGR